MNPLFLANPAAAPDWKVIGWIDADHGPQLTDLLGKVVVLHAFQMLCPGCVLHGVPQVARLFRFFDPAEVAVIGIHTVFENHTAMTPGALRVFMHEFRVPFPVAVDASDEASPIPVTMRRYQMAGTPTLVVIDRNGLLRVKKSGQLEDLAIGAAIQQLIDEPALPKTS